MFGYVKPANGELRVKEYNTYKAFYCGLCKCSGKCISCAARFTLSYDFVFLALLRMALSGEKAEFGTGACMAHPVKKRPYLKSNAQLEYCAAASALLTYHKVRDDISDEKGIKKIAKTLLLPHAAHMRKKAGLSELDSITGELLKKLSDIEKRRSSYSDEGAEVFGRLLGEYGAHALSYDSARIGREICFRIGKWIYFTDALDDFERDRKTGAYNPLTLSCKTKADALDTLRTSLSKELSCAEAALSLVECESGIYNILENIITKGLPEMTEKAGKAQTNQ